MTRILPRRKFTSGTRPGDTTKELYGKRLYNEEGEEVERESKWGRVRGELTKKDKRKIIGKVVEIAVKTLMRNHTYQFEGKYYIQKEGGSIGMAATGVIARLRMVRWSRLFKEKCRENRLELLM